jgi:SAM-dependent methyltransferase
LFCPSGHIYPIVDGIPILLLSETTQTHIEGTRSLQAGTSVSASPAPLPTSSPGEIDPFVQGVIAATNGMLYIRLIGKVTDYPIPYLRLPPGEGKRFLEIGCNWGRWCVAAARKGYCPVGIDPSLKAIRAARRVAQQLGITAHYVVADGRYLPFADGAFDQVFSYSVLQHLSKANARLTLREVSRVLNSTGGFLVQMPNCFGIRCLYHQVRRGFHEGVDFDVRYWTPWELASTFRGTFGSVRIAADGFFSLNPQISDVNLLPRKYRAVIYASEALRKISEVLSPLTYVADSLYVEGKMK